MFVSNLNFYTYYFYALYFSKYPCDQAVFPPDVPGGDGSSEKGSISCGDETKQITDVPFAW